MPLRVIEDPEQSTASLKENDLARSILLPNQSVAGICRSIYESSNHHRQYARHNMISEVVNSLFLTYLASEYIIAESRQNNTALGRRNQNDSIFGSIVDFARTRSFYIASSLSVVLLVNLLDHYSGLKLVINDLSQGFFQLPKVVFAAAAYVICLYYDIRRRAPLLKITTFLAKVGWAFLKVLPAYPFLAVVISFVFLFVINLWEALGLPLEWLNAPIYYGTLYGPFAWVYVHVKQQVLGEVSSLPV